MNGKREYDLRDQERREQAANVRVGALCRVEKFDPAAMRVDVQPLSKALDAGVYRTQPQILSVPVALVRGGGFVLRPCYKAGDVGVLLYIDHDIDRIAASGEESGQLPCDGDRGRRDLCGSETGQGGDQGRCGSSGQS